MTTRDTGATGEPADPLQRACAATASEARFVVAKRRGGGWIVNDRFGLVGGMFINETAAFHFAYEESDRHREQIIVIYDSDIAGVDPRRAA